MRTQAKVSQRRIEAALRTLRDLTAEEHDELDGRTRDEIAHVRHVLYEIILERSQ